MVRKIIVLVSILASQAAVADSYKCVDREGKTSFAFTPCPAWEGESTLYSPTADTHLDNPEAVSAEIVRSQLRAAQMTHQNRMESGGQRTSGVVVIPDTTTAVGKREIKRERKEAFERRKAEADARRNGYAY
jgi:hypothetical protein